MAKRGSRKPKATPPSRAFREILDAERSVDDAFYKIGQAIHDGNEEVRLGIAQRGQWLGSVRPDEATMAANLVRHIERQAKKLSDLAEEWGVE